MEAMHPDTPTIGGEPADKPKPPKEEENLYDQLAQQLEQQGKWSDASNIAKALFHARSLVEGRPDYVPQSIDPMQGVNLQTGVGAMQKDLDRSLAMGIGGTATMNPEERRAYMADLTSAYMGGRTDISKHATDVMNQAAASSTEAANLTAQQGAEVEMYNREQQMLNNQMEHLAKNVAVNQGSAAMDKVIGDRGTRAADMTSLHLMSQMYNQDPEGFMEMLMQHGMMPGTAQART